MKQLQVLEIKFNQVQWHFKCRIQNFDIFVLVVAGLLFAGGQTNDDLGLEVSIAFLMGAFASGLAGNIGMRAATAANTRTAMAANSEGQGAALQVAYNGGAVMGLCVGGLGLLGISVMYVMYGTVDKITYISGFGMGASSIASIR